MPSKYYHGFTQVRGERLAFKFYHGLTSHYYIIPTLVEPLAGPSNNDLGPIFGARRPNWRLCAVDDPVAWILSWTPWSDPHLPTGSVDVDWSASSLFLPERLFPLSLSVGFSTNNFLLLLLILLMLMLLLILLLTSLIAVVSPLPAAVSFPLVRMVMVGTSMPPL